MKTPATSAGHEQARIEAEDLGHPRGTLAIVVAFGALFALGWLVL